MWKKQKTEAQKMYVICQNAYLVSGQTFYPKSGDPSSLFYYLFLGKLHSDFRLLPGQNG